MTSIKDLQVQLPWTIKYSSDFRSNPQSHKDFAHALLHVQKACGKLAELVNLMDHDKDFALKPAESSIRGQWPSDFEPYIADLVVCDGDPFERTGRVGQTWVGGRVVWQRTGG
jgi:hypothetical protein